ncbi:HalOD1 output domain-containing protein [Halopelagius fulvigenes]|uniref:HalOD1 output domain-containing protein n=1 Tax=Halopelagius fulvigenes TaxID=1198324 RepID=A0ABD5TVV4_9EURY
MSNWSDSGETRRRLDTDAENPGVEVVKVVADLEGVHPTELTTAYDRVDGVLDHLFSNPPSPEARMRVQFRYEGYRITVEQNGNATFEKME